MGRLTRQANLRDEPDFLGLTEEQAKQLAAQRRLALRMVGKDRGYVMTADLRSNRVTAELEDGVIVYAQRY